MRRRTKLILRLALVAFLAAGAVAIARFAASEAAVAWLAQKLVAAGDGRLAIEGARGSLASTIYIATVRYEDEDLRVIARDVALAASLRALLTLRADLGELSVRELEILSKPSPGSPEPPANLALPLELAVSRGAIDKAILVIDGDRFEARRVSFGYQGSLTRHEVRALHLETMLGDLQGDLAVGAVRPFPIDGTLSIVRNDAKWPVVAQAKLAGSLERLDITLEGTVAHAKLDGTAQLAPFATSWLPRAMLHGADIDLARIESALPGTRFTFELSGESRDDGSIVGALSLRNAAPGALTDSRLPLVALDSPYTLKDNAVLFSALHADLGQAGAASGRATLAAGRATLDLAVRRLDLRAI